MKRSGWARLAAYVPAVIWSAFLIHLGGRADLTNPNPELPLDKVAHLVTYGLLGVCAGAGWRWAGRWPAAVWPPVLAFGVGVVDEIHQSTIPGRYTEVLDLVVNGIAIVIGFITVVRLPRLRARGPVRND